MIPLSPAETRRPGSLRELFLTYVGVSLQSFGGAVSFVERAVVRDKQWLTAHEFIGLYGLSRALPGPSGISLCVLIGDRFLGVRGALAAVLGYLLLPSVLVVAIASGFRQYQQIPAVQGALYGMGAASIGVIVHTAIRLSATLRSHRAGTVVALLSFIAIAWLREPLILVMLTIGLASMALAWKRLAA